MDNPPSQAPSSSAPSTDAASSSVLSVQVNSPATSFIEAASSLTVSLKSYFDGITTITPFGSDSRTSSSTSGTPNVGQASTTLVLVTSIVTEGPGSTSLFITGVPQSAVASSSPDSATSNTPNDSGNRLATILGPAIAIPILLIAVVVLGLLLWRRKRQNKKRVDSFNYVNPDEIAYMYSASTNGHTDNARPGLLRKITGGLFHNRLSELPGTDRPSGPAELPAGVPDRKDELHGPKELVGSEVGSDISPDSPLRNSYPVRNMKS